MLILIEGTTRLHNKAQTSSKHPPCRSVSSFTLLLRPLDADLLILLHLLLRCSWTTLSPRHPCQLLAWTRHRPSSLSGLKREANPSHACGTFCIIDPCDHHKTNHSVKSTPGSRFRRHLLHRSFLALDLINGRQKLDRWIDRRWAHSCLQLDWCLCLSHWT